ncbi:class II aldolase/adducin family protein [Ferrovibrio sp.]|uniref:class II aldolase/adducin family protein n=1 Tax=Ferrovibrio sp. TaxID=1917215 RepID=UPI00311E3D3D
MTPPANAALAPVSDIRSQVSAEEWQTRTDLAAAYRLVAHFGWDDLIFTHISARVPGPDEHFLINPYGWMFHEITASSLVKVDLDGNIVSPTENIINPAGFTIHSAVHAARHDVGCVIHLHTGDGIAVSAQADGLLPISQTAMIALSMLSYHEYEGIALDLAERERLVADLGQNNLMILRQHGTLACGRTVAQAFLNIHLLERACQAQVRALAGGVKLHPSSQAVQDVVKAQVRGSKIDVSGLAWAGLLRTMDAKDPSYRS